MPAKYCAQCGAELVLKIESGRERPTCPQCGFIVYRNPVPVALVVIEQGGKLLLGHRRNAPLANYWAPPAGYVEIDESLEAGAVREVKEETALDVAIDDMQHVYSRANTGVILVLFTAHVLGGALKPLEDEVLELRWFGPDELPCQPPPENGTLLESWFHVVIESVFREFKLSQGTNQE